MITRLLPVAAATLFACAGAHAVDAFDLATNLLTLESVSTGGQTYKNVAVTVSAYSQLSVAGGAPGADSFDQPSGFLTMGTVAAAGVTYNNVRVHIDSYTLLSAAGAPTPGTVATANYPGGTETASYFATLNSYRTQCGLPTLSQNAALDAAAPITSYVVGAQVTAAANAGYTIPNTVGDIFGNYFSNSVNQALVGKYLAQLHMTNAYALLSLMRPYSEVGLSYQVTKAGAVNQRGMHAMLGNPLNRGVKTPTTFPCANTTDVAPGSSYYSTQGVNYAAAPLGATTADDSDWGNVIGTPIAVMANPGDTLILNSASVTLQGGSAVPVVLRDYTKSAGIGINWPASANLLYSYEASVTPTVVLQSNSIYGVVINGTLNGAPFNKTFNFQTGSAIPVNLQ